MPTENNKKTYSRMKARKIIKKLIPDLPRNIVVHHRDLDPFNNNTDNLRLMCFEDHMSYHASISENWGRKIDTQKLLSKLESYLIIYNNY
jgi:hypothetical protein